MSSLFFTFFSATPRKTRLKFLGELHNITVTKGGSITLDCAATGYPLPVIEWKKVNGNVKGHKSSRGVSNLNFTNVDESDGGEYMCQASSDGKTVSRSVWLFVGGIYQFVLQELMYYCS